MDLINQNDRQKILAWNQTEHTYPQITIHELFEQSVINTPDRVAVVYEDKQISYETLNKNLITHYLRLGIV